MILLMAAGLGLMSCNKHRIEGNNHMTTETRETGSFEKVKASAFYAVNIHNDSLSRVVISAEENIIPYIKTEISGNTLILGTRSNFNLKPNYGIVVDVYTPVLKGIQLSGSGSVNSEYFSSSSMESGISGSGDISLWTDTPDLDLDISGSGSYYVKGSSNLATYTISGSGSIRASDMAVTNCYATISGSGTMHVNVSDELHVHISGSGDIYYSGSPTVDMNISGSGKVIHE
jgi:hypothetical protein